MFCQIMLKLSILTNHCLALPVKPVKTRVDMYRFCHGFNAETTLLTLLTLLTLWQHGQCGNTDNVATR